jgi:hypothetical protein
MLHREGGRSDHHDESPRVTPSAAGARPATRGSSFNETVRSRVIAVIRAGGTLAQAASEASIPRETLRSWVRRGHERPGTAYAAFSAEIDRARSVARADEALPELLVQTRKRAAAGSFIDEIALRRLEVMHQEGRLR